MRKMSNADSSNFSSEIDCEKENEFEGKAQWEILWIPKIETDKIEGAESLQTKRGPKLTENCHLTIVDMGNGCWTHHHFTSQI